jgi:hypothetical protein
VDLMLRRYITFAGTELANIRFPIRLVIFSIWFLPLAFLADPFALIRADFAQHAGLTAQFAESIREGEWLPLAVNSDVMIGDMSAMYYGRVLYLINREN